MQEETREPTGDDSISLPAEIEDRLFAEIVDRPPAERAANLRRLCDERPEHAAAIHSWVDAYERVKQLLERVATRPPTTINAPSDDESEDPDEPVPAQIGPYRILEELGHGGMGVVYLAEQRDQLHRRVALKLIRKGHDSRHVVARFEAERQALALMNHPSIARALAAGSTESGRPFFVMEYVPGIPLTLHCNNNRLSVRERLALFQPICHGVHHAHQKGIIHRDLKPSNILVMLQGEEAVPKIIDFGIAKAIGFRLTDKTLFTEQQRMIGTLQYMSPEQAELTQQDIDIRSDVFSLGVLLYELLVGALPIDWTDWRDWGAVRLFRELADQNPIRLTTRFRDLAEADRLKIAKQRRCQPRTLARQFHGDLNSIVLAALETDRNRRYASAAALADDIEHYLNGDPVSVGPRGTRYRARKLIAKNKATAAALAGLVLALIVGVVVSASLYRDATHAYAMLQREQDSLLIRYYTQEADRLYPELPHMVSPMQQWLAKAEALTGRRTEYERALMLLPERVANPQGSDWDSLQGENLASLIDRLEKFERDLIPSVRARLQNAQNVREQTIDKHIALWNEVNDSLVAHAQFGQRIAPQVGLVPIPTPDPHSRLWEFGHPRTGTVPRRGPDGRLEIDADTGLVFVLIPGGEYVMGAQAENPKGDNYDPMAAEREGPPHLVKVEPFFLSKYEMTQAQWERYSEENPSWYDPKTWRRHSAKAGLEASLLARAERLLPVEQVSWDLCDRVLWELGLVLPTEEQWEYAARAGVVTPWPTGTTDDGIEEFTNISDASMRPGGISHENPWPQSDGFPATAPVDAYPPNVFGLHNMLGNVWEWTRDAYRPSYGLGPPDSHMKAFRGGSFLRRPKFARYSGRQQLASQNGPQDIGLRPARILEK